MRGWCTKPAESMFSSTSFVAECSIQYCDALLTDMAFQLLIWMITLGVNTIALASTDIANQSLTTNSSSTKNAVIESKLFDFELMTNPNDFVAMQYAGFAKASHCLDSLARLPLDEARNASLTLGFYDCARRFLLNVVTESQLLAAVHPLPAYRAAAEDINTQASGRLSRMTNSTINERLAVMDATNEDSTTQQYVKELTRSLRRGPSGNESVYVEEPTTSRRPGPWDDEQYVEELTSPLWREHEQYIQDWTSWTRRREQSDTDTTTKSAIATVLSDLHQATQVSFHHVPPKTEA